MAGRRKQIAKSRSAAGKAAPAPAPSSLLQALKRGGPMSIRELAQHLGVTYEAVRQQISVHLREGWIAGVGAIARTGTASAVTDRKPGPASQQYRLSAAAEHIFPKHYDVLSAELVRLVLDAFGRKGFVEILGRMTDARVRRWAPLLRGMSVKEKLEALTSLYEDDDPYMQLEWQHGAPALIERNCPFLNVAQAHPAICSVSVNTLERLLGLRVVREQRFQAGHGRCLFRVKLDEPHPEDEVFTLER